MKDRKIWRAHAWRGLLLLMTIVWLSGCVSLKVPKTSTTYKVIPSIVRQARLKKIQHWLINGAFSVKSNEKVDIANYRWRQINAKDYTLNISSALNLYNVKVIGVPGEVTLWRSATSYISASTPEELLQRELGWSLPISNLYYWVRGVPAPGPHLSQFDRYGHLISLKQDGWQIELSSFIRIGRYDLPRIIALKDQAVAAKIVIKNWSLKS